MDDIQSQVYELGQRFCMREIPLHEWRDGLLGVTRELQQAAAAAVRGGVSLVTRGDTAYLGSVFDQQAQELQSFAQALLDQQLVVDGYLIATSHVQVLQPILTWTDHVAASGRCMVENLRVKIAAEEHGHTEARRLVPLGAACADSVALAARGWMPIEQMPPVGRLCGRGMECHCAIATRVAPQPYSAATQPRSTSQA